MAVNRLAGATTRVMKSTAGPRPGSWPCTGSAAVDSSLPSIKDWTLGQEMMLGRPLEWGLWYRSALGLWYRSALGSWCQLTLGSWCQLTMGRWYWSALGSWYPWASGMW